MIDEGTKMLIQQWRWMEGALLCWELVK